MAHPWLTPGSPHGSPLGSPVAHSWTLLDDNLTLEEDETLHDDIRLQEEDHTLCDNNRPPEPPEVLRDENRPSEQLEPPDLAAGAEPRAGVYHLRSGERVEPLDIPQGHAELTVLAFTRKGPAQFEVHCADDSVRLLDIDIVRTLPNGSAKLGALLARESRVVRVERREEQDAGAAPRFGQGAGAGPSSERQAPEHHPPNMH